MTGIVLALAAIIAPCEFDVPKSYLALFVAAPVVIYVVAATGALTLVTGVILVRLFVGFVGWIAYCEKAAAVRSGATPSTTSSSRRSARTSAAGRPRRL